MKLGDFELSVSPSGKTAALVVALWSVASCLGAPFSLLQSETAYAQSSELGEEDVKKAVDETIAARSKDGAFVFHDPKLDTDLNLVVEKVKIVRGMSGYGWFANTIFHDKDNDKKQYAIDFWFKPEGSALKLMGIRVQKGPKQ